MFKSARQKIAKDEDSDDDSDEDDDDEDESEAEGKRTGIHQHICIISFKFYTVNPVNASSGLRFTFSAIPVGAVWTTVAFKL